MPFRRLRGIAGPAALAILLTVAGLVMAQDAGGAAELAGAHPDKRFLAAPSVRVTASVADDVFAAAGQVIFEGARVEDIFAAAGELRISDTLVQDVIAAAGQVTLAANLAGDLIAAAGQVRLFPTTIIRGDAIVAGGDVELGGRIDGEARVAGGQVTVSGTIGRDAIVTTGHLVVTSGARIDGRLVYRSPRPADIAPGAVVAGGVRREMAGPAWERGRRIGILAGAAFLFLGMVVLGAVLLGAARGLIEAAAAAGEQRPWFSLLLGFAILAATPAAVVLLLASLLGAPLAVLLLLLYLAMLIAAAVVTAAWAGRMVRLLLRRPRPVRGLRSFLWFLLGLVLVFLVAAVPFAGPVLVLLAFLIALGGLVAQAWRRLQQPGLA